MSYDAVANGKLDTLLAAGSGPPKLLNVGYQVVPSAAGPVSLAPAGTAWTNGAYVQVTAGLGQAVYIRGVLLAVQSSTNLQWEVDIATGAAGSEVVVSTAIHDIGSAGEAGAVQVMFPDLIPVASGVRIAVRPRCNGTVAGLNCKLIYVQQANL